MREKEVEKRLCDGVKDLGGRAYKFISPGNNGVPDRLVVFPGGHSVFVELKTDRGALSPLQKNQIMTLRMLGARVHVLYGMEDVKQFLSRYREALKGGKR